MFRSFIKYNLKNINKEKKRFALFNYLSAQKLRNVMIKTYSFFILLFQKKCSLIFLFNFLHEILNIF